MRFFLIVFSELLAVSLTAYESVEGRVMNDLSNNYIVKNSDY